MGSTGHRGVSQGKRVKVFMRDGSKFVAKFKDAKSRLMHFFDHDSVDLGEVKTIAIWKGKDL